MPCKYQDVDTIERASYTQELDLVLMQRYELFVKGLQKQFIETLRSPKRISCALQGATFSFKGRNEAVIH